MISFIKKDYAEMLNSLLTFDRNVYRIKIANKTPLSFGVAIENGWLTFFLASPIAESRLAKMADDICCAEFLNFIKKHVYCEDKYVDVLTSTEALDSMTKCHFNF